MTIQIDGLRKTYNQDSDFPVHAVKALNLTIEQGEFVAVMGSLRLWKNHALEHARWNRCTFRRKGQH